MLQRTRISEQDKDGKTALHVACGTNNIEAVQVLLKASPELISDAKGRDPLKYAKEKKAESIVQLLDQYNKEDTKRREADARYEPFAPCDPGDTKNKHGLLYAVYVELMYMSHDNIIGHDKQNFNKINKLLKDMDPVHAVQELRRFQSSSDFDKTKNLCKKLLSGLHKARQGLARARNEELWVTRGQYEPGAYGSIVRPEIMMLTRDESCVMRELRGQVQNGLRPPGEPYLEKIFQMPAPKKGLPTAKLLFSEAKFVIPKAESEAQALVAVKSKLDEKDIEVCRLASSALVAYDSYTTYDSYNTYYTYNITIIHFIH